MDILMVKTIIVLAVIAGCFLVLYPKIFHPMVNNVLGASHANDQSEDMFMLKSPRNNKNGPGKDFPRQQRSGPHPAMRANADAIRKTMQGQQTTPGGGGGGRGMIGMVLPMYAVGIVIYLIYTLSKVFGGKKKQEADYLAGHFKSKTESATGTTTTTTGAGVEEEEAEEEEKHRDTPPAPKVTSKTARKQKKKRSRDLESLLLKADHDTLTGDDMSNLRERLQDTEKQMSMILQAMQGVQTKIEDQVNQSDESMSDDAGDEINMQMQEIRTMLVKQRNQKIELQKLTKQFGKSKREEKEEKQEEEVGVVVGKEGKEGDGNEEEEDQEERMEREEESDAEDEEAAKEDEQEEATSADDESGHDDQPAVPTTTSPAAAAAADDSHSDDDSPSDTDAQLAMTHPVATSESSSHIRKRIPIRIE